MLSQHTEAGKLEQKLLLTGILEADMGLGILACALYLEYLTDAETLMLDELTGSKLRHTSSST